MKTQTIRLVDVFILGPFMLWAAGQLKSDGARMAMYAAGVATIVYNGQNYLEAQKSESRNVV